MSEEEQQDIQKEQVFEGTEQELVLKRLLAAHEVWFNVFENHEFAGKTFEGYAEFHSVGEQYVLTKKAQLWEINSFEYLFFKLEDHITEQDIEAYTNFMTTEAIKKVQLVENHMSSYLSLVLIANSCDEGVERAVRKTKFRKNFAFGFRGWADLRFCVVDLGARKILSNAAGKQMVKTLEANAGFSDGKSKTKRR